MEVIKENGFNGHFSTYHVKTSIKKKKENPYKNYIKLKKKRYGRGRFYMEKMMSIYMTANYEPTKKDKLLEIPRCIYMVFCAELIMDRRTGECIGN